MEPWTEVSADSVGEIALPPYAGWRCAYGAAQIHPVPDGEYDAQPLFWGVSRSVYCSDNNWRSYAEWSHSFTVHSGRVEDESSVGTVQLRRREGEPVFLNILFGVATKNTGKRMAPPSSAP